MSLTKADTKLGNFIETGSNKVDGRAAAVKYAEQLGTPSLLWLLVKRHKVGLLMVWAVSMTIVYLLPFVPSMLLSFIQN